MSEESYPLSSILIVDFRVNESMHAFKFVRLKHKRYEFAKVCNKY